MTPWLRALATATLLLQLTACRPVPSADGELILRLRWSPEHLGGLRALDLEPDWGGVSRHGFRDAGWRRFGRTVDRVTLRSDDAQAVILTRGHLPAGDYARVFVAIPRVTGRDGRSRPVAVNAHIEPIARPLTLVAGGRAVVDLVIAILPTPPQSPFDEPVQAFIMDAQLAGAPQLSLRPSRLDPPPPASYHNQIVRTMDVHRPDLTPSRSTTAPPGRWQRPTRSEAIDAAIRRQLPGPGAGVRRS